MGRTRQSAAKPIEPYDAPDIDRLPLEVHQPGMATLRINKTLLCFYDEFVQHPDVAKMVADEGKFTLDAHDYAEDDDYRPLVLIRRLIDLALAMQSGSGGMISALRHGHPDEPEDLVPAGSDEGAEPAAKRAKADRAIVVSFTEWEDE
jgi:hypothetical protein